METQKTALYNYHKSLGAKFVPFAGYEMPVQYPSGIVEEHKLTRAKAGLFDVSHMGQLLIEGKDDLAIELEKIIPTDLKKIKLNQSKYSFLTNESGGIYDDLIVTKVENGFNIILNAACKNNDFKIIENSLKNKFKLTLHKKLSLIALQGPKSSEILEKTIKGVSSLKFMNGNKFSHNGKDIYVTRSGYTGEDGFEISMPNELVEDFAKKLAKELSKRSTGRTMFILDEPTTGLHAHDIKKLLEILQTFVVQGNTVVVIEHNLDVIKTADWIIDMGPDGGVNGGQIIAEGNPEKISEISSSFTGNFLKNIINTKFKKTA